MADTVVEYQDHDGPSKAGATSAGVMGGRGIK